jgi:hypothetical protein
MMAVGHEQAHRGQHVARAIARALGHQFKPVLCRERHEALLEVDEHAVCTLGARRDLQANLTDATQRQYSVDRYNHRTVSVVDVTPRADQTAITAQLRHSSPPGSNYS